MRGNTGSSINISHNAPNNLFNSLVAASGDFVAFFKTPLFLSMKRTFCFIVGALTPFSSLNEG